MTRFSLRRGRAMPHNRGQEQQVFIADMSNQTPAVTPEPDTAAPSAPSKGAQSSEATISTILQSLEDSKAEDIVTLPLEPGAALADVMIVASGRSNRHVSAVADHLLRRLKKAGIKGFSVEGLEHADWVLVDTGDVIVHIFRPEVRAFYNLEKLWSPHAPRQDT